MFQSRHISSSLRFAKFCNVIYGNRTLLFEKVDNRLAITMAQDLRRGGEQQQHEDPRFTDVDGHWWHEDGTTRVRCQQPYCTGGGICVGRVKGKGMGRRRIMKNPFRYSNKDKAISPPARRNKGNGRCE